MLVPSRPPDLEPWNLANRALPVNAGAGPADRLGHAGAVLVDVQFNPANNDWPRLRDANLAAEAAGFGATWVYDHLAGSSLHGTWMLESSTLLGALAAVTSTIGLGTLVANVFNREPGVLAVAAASAAAIADRPLMLGLGAGTSPTSQYAAEQHAVGTRIEPDLARRHARVEQVIDLLDAMRRPDRDQRFATFPQPDPPPLVLLGVNSVALAELAGRRTRGINVWWGHPRRDELLAAADGARPGHGAWLRTAWTIWDDGLLDGDHPSRREMADRRIDRLVLAVIGVADADRVARCSPT